MAQRMQLKTQKHARKFLRTMYICLLYVFSLYGRKSSNVSDKPTCLVTTELFYDDLFVRYIIETYIILTQNECLYF